MASRAPKLLVCLTSSILQTPCPVPGHVSVREAHGKCGLIKEWRVVHMRL